MKTISRLSEFIGKDLIKNNLSIFLDASKKNNTSLEHCLFYGLPGTGKTTLAKIIANELNHKIRIVQGSSIQKPLDVINLLLTTNNDDVLFIDEIHAINKGLFELFYSAMEEGYVDLNIGRDFNAKITRIKLPNFTLIGATTSLGMIPRALEDRFGIVFSLDEYTDQEIYDIIKMYSNKMKLNLSDQEVSLLVSAAKGIPRVGYKLVRRVYDFKTINENIKVEEILKNIGYIYKEFDKNDLVYLKALDAQDHPLGIKTLSQITSIDEQTIMLKIEPYLLKKKLINKTQNGRVITKEGYIILRQLENLTKEL